MYKLAVFAVVAGMLACKDSGGPMPCKEITEGAIFEARIHETWCLPDESLKITFQSIVEDGRCNVKGIECVWAGRAVLEFLIEEEGAQSYRDTLYTNDTWKGELELEKYTLSLLQIKPLERQDFVVDTAAYRFNMVLE